MIATIESSDLRTLVLTPLESKELLELLDQAVGRSGSDDGTNALLSAQDKLDDADGIAGWLRENVAFEPTSQETLAVAEILLEHLTSERDLPGMSRATLSAVSERISPCIARQACR